MNFSHAFIYVLPDITGLRRWVDYIPVQAGTANGDRYDDTGSLHTQGVLDDATGLTAWVDYLPVYVEGTDAWRYDDDGYIPYNEVAQSVLLLETGDNILLESGGNLLI